MSGQSLVAVPPIAEYAQRLGTWLDDNRARYGRSGNPPASTEQKAEAGAELLSALYAAGWNRCGFPVAAGGLGGDARYRGVLYDEIARRGYDLAPQFVSTETLLPAVIAFAPELAARWGPAFLAGRELWSQGFSEPESGSDLASLRCRAVPAESGGQAGWTVNGQKIWTSDGHVSQRIALLARTGTPESRHRGLSMFMVDMDAPGLTVRPVRLSSGHNEFAEVFFDDVFVPAGRIVGQPGEGWAVAMYLMQYERGFYAWQRQAILAAKLDRLRAELAADDPDACRRLGEASLALTALRARSAGTVARLAAGETIGPEASIDKVLLAEAERQVGDAARDTLRGLLVTSDDAAAAEWRSYWFFSRAASILGGTQEIQRSIIADHVLGLPKETR